MKHKIERQSLTSRQSFGNSDSKKTKSIKSIRIVDNDKENTYTHARQSSKIQEYPHTARDHSPSPHEFSFKKQQIIPNYIQQNNDEWILRDKINSQEQQMKKLQRMLKSMNAKIQEQAVEYDRLKPMHEEYLNDVKENSEFKREIYQLKELMKELLIEKENDRMMVFYQDS